MSTIKSFSVKNGDMFYIKHNTKNFTIIDCNLVEERKEKVINEIICAKKGKEIIRFISTHPDKDHLLGLSELDNKLQIRNFYCVDNKIKFDDEDDFNKYCELRDNVDKHFPIFKNCSRKWLNQTYGANDDIGSSEIFILWPNINNESFKYELEKLENGENDSANNISPIIKYSLDGGVTALWFGDMENDFLEKVKDEIDFPKADVIFAPHHGRNSGKIPKDILDKIEPKLIIIGEAKSEYLNYYDGFNTITQNTAKNIVLECVTGKIDVYTEKEFDEDFLKFENGKCRLFSGEQYRGTLNLN
ncbi:hypothetical protein [uncultured Methanobrevibacter sp.]|uniref:hypothetical protein n=1 Tax=uncultured Methanobrevibacter sp. TaxID=253161 RepID=UPI0026285A75|nr:hypothetical protein [uncultured Methanobrevibacter sp.]